MGYGWIFAFFYEALALKRHLKPFLHSTATWDYFIIPQAKIFFTHWVQKY